MNFGLAEGTFGFSPGFYLVVGTIIALTLLRDAYLPQIKGWLGERSVRLHLYGLPRSAYRRFHDIYLERADGDGTTQIDHILVSAFGVFVIETKNYKGWIFGHEKQKTWTQKFRRSSYSFQNPLHQNALHIRSLAKALNLPTEAFHSIVYFVGDCTLKTNFPDHVLDRGLNRFIREHREILFSQEQVGTIIEALECLERQSRVPGVARRHREALKKRHG